jgi:hypothetical protein
MCDCEVTIDERRGKLNRDLSMRCHAAFRWLAARLASSHRSQDCQREKVAHQFIQPPNW